MHHCTPAWATRGKLCLKQANKQTKQNKTRNTVSKSGLSKKTKNRNIIRTIESREEQKTEEVNGRIERNKSNYISNIFHLYSSIACNTVLYNIYGYINMYQKYKRTSLHGNDALIHDSIYLWGRREGTSVRYYYTGYLSSSGMFNFFK